MVRPPYSRRRQDRAEATARAAGREYRAGNRAEAVDLWLGAVELFEAAMGSSHPCTWFEDKIRLARCFKGRCDRGE